MKFIAIVECPQGQAPGEIFEATEDAGNVLVMVGAAKRYDEPTKTEPAKNRNYSRRDLEAEK